MSDPLVEAIHIKKDFFIKKQLLRALDDVSFSIFSGETLGLVGESGSGKSTLGKILLQLFPPSEGKVFFQKKDLSTLDRKELKKFRKEAQMVFQDPYSSLNPRMSIYSILEEPYLIHKETVSDKMLFSLLDLVKLPKTSLKKYPHEFSGGQRQRIAIARALSLRPKFVVCDEPVSSLDVSVQAQILNLLTDLQKDLKLTYLFISHDLAVVKYLSTRVAILYEGNIVEMAKTEDFYKNPQHPYTKELLASTIFSFKTSAIKSSQRCSGCSFAHQCPFAKELCFREKPKLLEIHAENNLWNSSYQKELNHHQINLKEGLNRTQQSDQIKSDHFVACHLATGRKILGI